MDIDKRNIGETHGEEPVDSNGGCDYRRNTIQYGRRPRS